MFNVQRLELVDNISRRDVLLCMIRSTEYLLVSLMILV